MQGPIPGRSGPTQVDIAIIMLTATVQEIPSDSTRKLPSMSFFEEGTWMFAEREVLILVQES
jgi:hypothetical protein